MKYYIRMDRCIGGVGRLLQERAGKVYQLASWYVPSPNRPGDFMSKLEWNIAMTAYCGSFHPEEYQEIQSLEEFKDWWINENFLFLL